jgi:LCP family protein required for cell wall assembly
LGQGGETEQAGGDLTDSMMIASLDPINMKLTLLSIPRDLWVDPAGYWPMKINAVYESAEMRALSQNPKNLSAAENAGFKEVCNIVQQYLGVQMNYYAMIEFSAFQQAVDTLGGINVTLSQSYSDPTMLIGSKYLYLPAGTSHLDGAWALGYARSRHGAARGDFDRGEHQQQVLVGIKDKVMTLGTYSNPVKVSDLLGTFGDRVHTNISITDMMRIYDIIKKMPDSAITHVDLDQTPGAVVTTGMIGNQSVVYPLAGVNDYTAVQAFVRTNLKDGFLTKENASVIVLNGTTKPDLASQEASVLKGYGYRVIATGNAPKQNLTATILIDNTRGVDKYTRHYLEQRLGTSAVSSVAGLNLSAFKANFIIIMGS